MKKKTRRPAATAKAKDLAAGKGEHTILDEVARGSLFKKPAPQTEKITGSGGRVE